MKKILILVLCLFSFEALSVDKSTTFSIETFNKAQEEGKTVVVNSWNETCYTCKKQIKILDQAEKKFKDILFLSFEQTKDKEIAKFLEIEYWTTIVIYKNNKEISRSIGQTDKATIYSTISKSL
jgi:thioredoxin 1|tara:strand:- start:1300 stop:1671 length:372 start_codon:yes stop_codon:yes gene_type:complete